MEEITYSSFESMDEAQRISLFDKGVCLSLFASEKRKRKFLKDVFERSGNNYFRKRAVECLSLMCIFQETENNIAALSLLLDIEENDDELVLVSSIKYLFLLNEKLGLDDAGILSKIDSLRFHVNADVASSAEYYSGLNHILKANDLDDQAGFVKAIGAAEECFATANELCENRMDALVLAEFCKLVKLLIRNDKEAASKCLSAVHDYLIEKKNSFIYLSMPDFDVWLFKLAASLHDFVLSDTSEWLDIAGEVNSMCCLYYKIIEEELNHEYSATSRSLSGAIVDFVAKPFCRASLIQHKAAVRRLGREAQDDQLKWFCSYLIDWVGEEEIKKKPDIDIAVAVLSAFPHADHNKIKKDIESTDLDDPAAVVRLCGSYYYQNMAPVTPVTGSRTGDEIFRTLIGKIEELLPDYQIEKLLEFKVVLSDVIRYAVLSSEKKSSGAGFFKFLFDENAVEKDLQDSMLAHFEMSSNIGSRYSPEVIEIADGGRVDIRYQSDRFTLPIELKKTDEVPTKELIVKSYLAQAQTYCYPHDQLGVFVLLDNSSKAKRLQSPINDLREHFSILHLEPYYKVETVAPDYVVSVIIPGNKVTPSSRSTYK